MIEPVYNLLLLVIGTFLSITLSLFLLTVKSVKNNANVFLGIHLLLLSTYFIQGLFYRLDWLELMPHVVHSQIGFEALGGAVIYLYVRACTEKDFEMKPVLWLHFAPLLLALIYHSSFFLQTGAEKVAFYHRYVTEFDIGVPIWVTLLKTLLGTVYFVLATRLVFQYKKHLNNEVSSIDKDYHRWLLLFSSSALLPILGIIFWGLIGGSATVKALILTFLIGFIFSIYVIALLKPEIFHTFPNQIKVEEKEIEKRQRYENSNLQESQKDKFIEKLVAYMQTKKPYQESDLTLATLANQVNIPAHYLSQVINERMKCTFLDFVNGYRVEEAKRMLVDNKYENYTIMAVAYEAGFNSKTTFYSAFKKHMGMTPSVFKKNASRISA